MKKISYLIFTCIFILENCTSDSKSHELDSLSKDEYVFKDTSVYSGTIIEKLIKSTPKFMIGEGEEKDEVCNFNFSFLGRVFVNSKVAYYCTTLSIDLGTSCKNTTRILFYDNLFNYVGSYYTDGILPTNLDNNLLLGNEWPQADLSKGIPDSISLGANMWAKLEK